MGDPDEASKATVNDVITPDGYTDPSRLKNEAYKDPANLLARADIYKFAVPKIEFPTWAAGRWHISLRRRESSRTSAVDRGCTFESWLTSRG